MNTSVLTLRITDLAQDATGVWRAVVYMDGESRQVDRSQGCWRVSPPDGVPPLSSWQEVTPHVAAELQREVRKYERRDSADTKEPVMPAASKQTKAAKPTKAAAKRKATNTAGKPAAKKAAAKKGTTAPRLSRDEAQAKAAEALKMHEAGKSYVDIAKALGWANPGVAWNAVARAKKARDAK